MPKPSAKLNHFDQDGQAHMVNVGAKAATSRLARAGGSIRMQPETMTLVTKRTAKKGDVLGIARLAAIMATKRTSDLIPLCHPLALTHVKVDFQTDAKSSTVTIEVTAETTGQTGVEMEALTGASVGLLTIYDMLKAADRGMVIENLRLLEKSGGKSGNWQAEGKVPKGRKS